MEPEYTKRKSQIFLLQSEITELQEMRKSILIYYKYAYFPEDKELIYAKVTDDNKMILVDHPSVTKLVINYDTQNQTFCSISGCDKYGRLDIEYINYIFCEGHRQRLRCNNRYLKPIYRDGKSDTVRIYTASNGKEYDALLVDDDTALVREHGSLMIIFQPDQFVIV